MPPKTLHTCNLANVAYGYCKLLCQAGYPIELRCHDITHLMSQPEWDDLELFATDFSDENNFFNNTADFGSYCRPDWFHSCSLFPGNSERTTHDKELTPDPARLFVNGLKKIWKIIPQPISAVLKPPVKRMVFSFQSRRKTDTAGDLYRDFHQTYIQNESFLVETSKKYGPEWTVSKQMLAAYHIHAWWLMRHMPGSEVVFSYVLTPIYAMILDNVPYVSIEIGTMRDIPFDGTDTGKLLALAYRRSHHVLITNPDVKSRADELGLQSYSFCPHPVDEEAYVTDMQNDDFRHELLEKHDAERILFAPARQNWEIKGNDRYIRAFARLLGKGIRAVLIIPGWGQEVDRSKTLCRDLGIESRVVWISPQSEGMLLKYYKAADFVLDQFKLGVFGLTTPKAMSCGAVVLTSYDKSVHDWCFSEHPPLVRCSTEKEVFEALYGLSANPDRLATVSAQSRQWVCQHHSKAVIRNILVEAMDRAKENFRAQGKFRPQGYDFKRFNSRATQAWKSNSTITVVKVNALSYSGATWLELVLGSCDGAFAIGSPDRVVNCLNIKNFGADACMVHGAICSFWPMFGAVVDPAQNFYLQLAAVSESEVVIIDNPSRGGKAERDLDHPKIVVKEINLVRDGRAIVAQHCVQHPELQFKDVVAGWFVGAAQNFAFGSDDTNVLNIKYEDMCEDPEQFFQKMANFIGIGFSKTALRYWMSEHHVVAGDPEPVTFIQRHTGQVMTGPDCEILECCYQAAVTAEGCVDSNPNESLPLSDEDRIAFDYFAGEINAAWGYERDWFKKTKFIEFEQSLATWIKDRALWGKIRKRGLYLQPRQIKRIVIAGGIFYIISLIIVAGISGQFF